MRLTPRLGQELSAANQRQSDNAVLKCMQEAAADLLRMPSETVVSEDWQRLDSEGQRILKICANTHVALGESGIVSGDYRLHPDAHELRDGIRVQARRQDCPELYQRAFEMLEGGFACHDHADDCMNYCEVHEEYMSMNRDMECIFRLLDGVPVLLRGYMHDQGFQSHFGNKIRQSLLPATYLAVESDVDTAYGDNLEFWWKANAKHYDALMRSMGVEWDGRFVELDIRQYSLHGFTSRKTESSDWLDRIGSCKKINKVHHHPPHPHERIIHYRSLYTDESGMKSVIPLDSRDCDAAHRGADPMLAVKIHQMVQLMHNQVIDPGVIVSLMGALHTWKQAQYLNPDLLPYAYYQLLMQPDMMLAGSDPQLDASSGVYGTLLKVRDVLDGYFSYERSRYFLWEWLDQRLVLPRDPLELLNQDLPVWQLPTWRPETAAYDLRKGIE